MTMRDSPAWIPLGYAAKVHGTVAVVSHDGSVITTYRNSKILRRLKKRRRWDMRHLPASAAFVDD